MVKKFVKYLTKDNTWMAKEAYVGCLFLGKWKSIVRYHYTLEWLKLKRSYQMLARIYRNLKSQMFLWECKMI